MAVRTLVAPAAIMISTRPEALPPKVTVVGLKAEPAGTLPKKTMPLPSVASPIQEPAAR